MDPVPSLLRGQVTQKDTTVSVASFTPSVYMLILVLKIHSYSKIQQIRLLLLGKISREYVVGCLSKLALTAVLSKHTK